MELMLFYSYIAWHETTRNSPTTGEASPTRYPVTGEGNDGVGDRPLDRRLEEFRCTMARRIPAQRCKSTSPKTNSRASLSIVRPPEEGVDPNTFRGPSGCRVWNGPLDAEASCPSDQEAVPDQLSSESSLAAPGTTGMELSETRTSCPPTGRKGNRTLESDRLASHKKKPHDLAPISYSWMKAAFYSSPMSGGPGRRGARPRISTTGSNRIEYLRSAHSASLQAGGTSGSICSSGRTVLRIQMSRSSWDISSVTSADPSCCCGIGGQSTVTAPSNRSLTDTRECTQSSFLPMHPNSTRRSTSGIDPTLRSPTASRRVSCSSEAGSMASRAGSARLNNASGHVFMQATYRGGDEISFLYLCESQ